MAYCSLCKYKHNVLLGTVTAYFIGGPELEIPGTRYYQMSHDSYSTNQIVFYVYNFAHKSPFYSLWKFGNGYLMQIIVDSCKIKDKYHQLYVQVLYLFTPISTSQTQKIHSDTTNVGLHNAMLNYSLFSGSTGRPDKNVPLWSWGRGSK
jgi:hypothetical protein